MKYFFFDRLKYKTEESNKYYKKFIIMQQIQNLLCAFGSSFISLIFTYPFDLAYTRKTAKLITDGNYKNFRQCFHTKTENLIYNDASLKRILDNKLESNNNIFRWKYYDKFSMAICLSGLSTFFNMSGFSLIKNRIKEDKNNEINFTNKFCNTLGYTSLLTIITSPIIYPFDTLLRQMQVDGGRGYYKKYENLRDGLNQMKIKINTFEFHR